MTFPDIDDTTPLAADNPGALPDAAMPRSSSLQTWL